MVETMLPGIEVEVVVGDDRQGFRVNPGNLKVVAINDVS
jgi:hypothetical protein